MITNATNLTAAKAGMNVCHTCMTASPVDNSRCELCGSHIHEHKKSNLQAAWALLITSLLLYIPANFMPIMSTTFLGDSTNSTIMGGIITLWHHGSYPIAIVIFIASIFVPVGKLIALTWLCISVHSGKATSLKEKTQLYRITEFIGRWSMVDVFVVAILVALIRLGNIMSIYPGMASMAFAAMVITTMLAAMSFDPRLIWIPVNNVVSDNE
jgi:paraquat-inducible protein A